MTNNTAIIRDIQSSDYPEILDLNDASVQFTSPLDQADLENLLSYASYKKVAVIDGQIAGFLIAIDHKSTYINDNLNWFQSQYSSFIYVDRIVIGSKARGAKVGSKLYSDLFATAKNQGISLITCEYNLKPLNEASKRFHDHFGFSEVGSKPTRDNKKIVSMQIAPV